MTVNEKIAKVRELMKKNGVSAYIIPSSDPHISEYFSDHWKTRAFLSGFSGSAGTFLITDTMSGLWTDGRYYVQAATELAPSEATLFKMSEPDCPSVTKYLANNLSEGAVVGINGKLFSAFAVKNMKEKFEKKSIKINNELDLANDVWEGRPTEVLTEVYDLEVKYAGKSAKEKIEELRGKLKEKEADALVVGKLDCIAWLYNIRANDVKNNPVVISYAFVSPNEAVLFTDSSRIPQSVTKTLTENGVTVQPYNEVFNYVEGLKEKMTVICEEKEINYSLFCKVEANEALKALNKENPIQLLKACKNETETKNTYQAYIKDGCAEVEFYGWLDEEMEKGTKLTEYTISEKLTEFRSQQKDYKGDSFTAILAYKENAAMMHYGPKEDTAKVIEASNLLLNDSGGQYLNGTTDTTRTIAMGPITDTERTDFTLVLQSVIALSKAIFKEGTTGSQLDCLSRENLWKRGVDYRCGTGHGVGYLLNVHEGPHGFSDKENKLLEGMVLTIEPGIYTEGSHGIRTENTVVVSKDIKTEYGQFYHFDTFTVVPIDVDCLDLNMMTQEEIDWINDYHKHTFDTIEALVSSRAKKWLEKKTKSICKG